MDNANASAQYWRYVNSPVNGKISGLGFPDGSTRPCVVVDARQITTITPSSGAVKFALVGSLYGCLAIGKGTVTTSYPQFSGTTDLSITWNNATKTLTSGYYVLAHDAVAANLSTPGAVPFGPFSAVKYRTLSSVADIMFTGSTTANGGLGKCWKTFVSGVKANAQDVVNTVSCDQTLYSDVTTAGTIDTSTDAFPARETYSVRTISPRPEFQELPVQCTSTTFFPLAYNSSGNGTGHMPWPGLDESFGVTVVEYSGLDASASITVESRVSFEIQPVSGAMSGLTQPSPPADLGLWARLTNLVQALPVTSGYRVYQAYQRGGVNAALEDITVQVVADSSAPRRRLRL